MSTSDNISSWTFVGDAETNTLQKQISEIKNINKNVKVLGPKCFESCQKLQNINLYSSSVEEIGENCFLNCVNVSDVVLPATLRRIKQFAFKNCSSLSDISWKWFNSENGGNTNAELTEIQNRIFQSATLSHVVFPPSINSKSQIADNALADSVLSHVTFMGCSKSELEEKITSTYAFGLRHDCEFVFSDRLTYKYTFVSNGLDKTGTANPIIDILQKGDLPVTTDGKTRYKMKLGVLYRFEKRLVGWCRSEHVPFMILNLNTYTNFRSRSISINALQAAAFISRLKQTSNSGVRFYLFVLDHGLADVESGVADFYDMYGNNHDYATMIAEYGGRVQTASISGLTANDVYDSISNLANIAGFNSWDSTPYMQVFENFEPETAPTNPVSTALGDAIGLPWWYS